MRRARDEMIWLAALGLLTALAFSAHSTAFGAEAGCPGFLQVFQRDCGGERNFSAAVPELRNDAERGDRNAQYKLGLVYDVGVGAKQDLAEAALWYRRAADQGHVAAQFNLGLMYANSRGVPPDLVQAHMWLNLAAAASAPAARTERDLVATKMTRLQVSEAVRLAHEWQPKAPAPLSTDARVRQP
jgi:TPR repeat protein